jgi:hypothetical protein
MESHRQVLVFETNWTKRRPEIHFAEGDIPSRWPTDIQRNTAVLAPQSQFQEIKHSASAFCISDSHALSAALAVFVRLLNSVGSAAVPRRNTDALGCCQLSCSLSKISDEHSLSGIEHSFAADVYLDLELRSVCVFWAALQPGLTLGRNNTDATGSGQIVSPEPAYVPPADVGKEYKWKSPLQCRGSDARTRVARKA